MTDHAHELRRYARKIAHPAGDVPAVMLAAADEIEYLRAENAALVDDMNLLRGNNASLRACIEEMKRQKPVRWFYVTNGEWDCYSRERPPEDAYDAGSLMALYALPGAQAQPAPSIPDGWKLVPTAESRHPGIYKMLSALHAVDNTPGASEWESYAAFLAAAPEAKP